MARSRGLGVRVVSLSAEAVASWGFRTVVGVCWKLPGAIGARRGRLCGVESAFFFFCELSS